MPVYEYTCDQCGHIFEQWQSYQDPPIQVCPNCHQKAVRKLFSSTGIIFKGSGWYVNDSRKAESATLESKSAAPASESNSDSAKSENQPASTDGGNKATSESKSASASADTKKADAVSKSSSSPAESSSSSANKKNDA